MTLRTALCAILLAALPLVHGCRVRLPSERLATGIVEVGCCPVGGDPVRLTYLGAAGWLIERGPTAVLTAPLFSNPSLRRTGLGTIRSDSARIERRLPDVTRVTAILVGHAHYDHLMDVPYVALRRAPAAVIYGDRTVGHTLAPFGLRRLDGCVATGTAGAPDVQLRPRADRRVCVVEDAAGNLARPGAWITIGPGVRMMPVLSNHGPHFAGETLYAGERRADLKEVPQRADQWLAGQPLAYLIDLLDPSGAVAMRIFYTDTAPSAPWGQIPPLEDGRRVDVALLVPATYAEVRWHPEAQLENLRPRHVLLEHWEDLFSRPEEAVRPVPFTDLPDFVARLTRVLPAGVGWHLPLPGTVFLFR